jgi:hypothetical protein
VNSGVGGGGEDGNRVKGEGVGGGGTNYFSMKSIPLTFQGFLLICQQPV